MYLVQRVIDGERVNSLMNADELIQYINMSDCFDEEWHIYDVSEFGKVIPIHYVGWQPDCLIQFANDNDVIVLSGYGTDH